MSEKVASFAEAWIEILDRQRRHLLDTVASFAEAWIEIHDADPRGELGKSRLLRGGVD